LGVLREVTVGMATMKAIAHPTHQRIIIATVEYVFFTLTSLAIRLVERLMAKTVFQNQIALLLCN
jgi:uncharacterized membrane protein